MTQKRKLLLVLPEVRRGFWGTVSKTGKAGFARLSLPVIASLVPDHWEAIIHDARSAPVPYDADVDLVGITAMTMEIDSAYEIAERFRERGKTVVIGGVHASALPDEALEHCNCVVIGEAEGVFRQLLDDFEAGVLKPRYQSDKLVDLAGMPLPRRDLVKNTGVQYTGFHTVQATRGCPFDCEFCSVTTFFGNSFRMRPVNEVIDEIRTFDSRQFFLLDDNIVGNSKYAKELFRALIPLKKVWGTQASITLARDRELLNLYAKSGGRYVFIGFESLGSENLKQINKSWNSLDSYSRAIRRIRKAGICVIGSFIFGLDQDDASVFRNTVDFIMKHKIDVAHMHLLTPFPGTRLYNRMHAEGRIVDFDWSKYNLSEAVIFHPKMTTDEMMAGYYWAWREVYKFKNIFKRSLTSVKGLPYRAAANYSFRRKTQKMPDVPPPM